MSTLRYLQRSLTYFWRTHLGVAAGAAIATAVLVGALVVGDSVRHSLRRMALQRLGDVTHAMHTADRYFTGDLLDGLTRDHPRVAGALQLNAVASVPGTQRRAFKVRTLGVDDAFWAIGGAPPQMIGADEVVLNDRLAKELEAKPGDTVLLRMAKPSSISGDIPLSNEATDSVTLRVKVKSVVDAESFGNFSTQAEQVPPFNAFVSRKALQAAAELNDRLNTVLVAGAEVDTGALGAFVDAHWTLRDIEADLRELPDAPGGGVYELRSDRVFLDPPLVEGVGSAGIGGRPYITYFVNELRNVDRAAPYSMVSTLPADSDVKDEEIVLTDWLAEDIGARVGDRVTLTFSRFAEARQIEEEDATFVVAMIVAVEAPGGDRHLMPDLPGLNDVDDLGEWDPPADLGVDTSKIRDQDEDFWDKHRGAPKAFVTLRWASENWRTPYGSVTSIRWPMASRQRDELTSSIRGAIEPAQLGLFFQPVREQALAASGQGTDFGGLFIGLSFFLMVAALLLMALLFVFGVEQRSAETGTLLALGFTPRKIRRLWLLEGGALAVVGALLGVGIGVAYTQVVLWALTTLWTDAVAGTTDLVFHASVETIVIGAASGVLVALSVMRWALRRQAQQPARALLASRFGLESGGGRAGGRRWGLWVGFIGIAGAIAIAIGAGGHGGHASPGAFFGAGSLLLIGALSIVGSLLRSAGAGGTTVTIAQLGWRNGGRRSGRSLATVSMLACAAFLVVSINAFRHDASHAALDRHSGTGGFALYAETSLPVYHDLNTQKGLDAFGLYADELEGVSFVPMRLREGDDASCLNLNKPQTPALLGVDPAQLARRDAFVFVAAPGGDSLPNPWRLLSRNDEQPDAPVPAILDASVAQWILKKGVGDTIEYTDESGRPFQIRIAGTITNSILQGRMLISDAQFKRRYPSLSAYRVFLVDTPPDRIGDASETLESALSDVGFDAMPATERLSMFLQVENTYLTIFGVLGGLGLVLGCVGLGLVVLRNVLERRSELALMRSLGFRGGTLKWLVLVEHWGLLMLGLLCGVIAAGVAIWPAVNSPQTPLSVRPIVATLVLVLFSGVAWTLVATVAALRGKLIAALRAE